MRGYDNSDRAWILRDRDVEGTARRLRDAVDIGALHDAANNALGYLTLAAQAGQTERAQKWAVMFGDARDAAHARLFGWDF